MSLPVVKRRIVISVTVLAWSTFLPIRYVLLVLRMTSSRMATGHAWQPEKTVGYAQSDSYGQHLGEV